MPGDTSTTSVNPGGIGTSQRRVIYACSGASELGDIADRAARSVSRRGLATMKCAASIGAGDADAIDTARRAARRIAVDGCEKQCVARLLERAGIGDVMRINLIDFERTTENAEVVAPADSEIAARIESLLL